MKILAIIPARGGSKRIERKNVRFFHGKPIIAYSIEAARRSGVFDEIMVSTDDSEIAEVGRRYGAEVPFMRSSRTSDDYATTADVINEVLENYGRIGKRFDAICCIYATAPFVTPWRLEEAARILKEGRAQAAFTCVEYSYPIQRSLRVDSAGRIGMTWPEYATARSQDLEKRYHDAGQFYFTTTESFEKSGTLWGPDTRPVILPELQVQDLDTETDWRIAEMKFSALMMPERIELSDSSDTGETELVNYRILTESENAEMLRGRNLEQIRRQMITESPISESDHRAFVESLRTRPDKAYYLVRYNGETIGSINTEQTGERSMERGIWLFPEYQGRGLAGKILSRFYDWLARNRGVTTIETRVKRQNAASNALERHLGATETSSDRDYRYYKLHI